MSQALTDWFPPHLKPARDGWYDARVGPVESTIRYWWSADRGWMWRCGGNLYVNQNKRLYWRGLAQPFDVDKATRLRMLEEAATEIHGSDEIEVDPLASEKEISEGVDGIWVRAWVFVSNAECEARGIENPEAIPEKSDA